MINIADQLHAATEQGIVAASGEIFDPVLQARQSAMNMNAQKAFHGAIVFDNTDTGEEGITAVRFPNDDTASYLCFITESGVRYYATSMDEGAYVYYPNSGSEGYSQIGVILTKVAPISGGGGSEFNPEGTYPKLTAGNLLAKETDAVQDTRSSFLFRSTAGSQSVSDGKAKLTELFGNLIDGVPFTGTHLRSIGYNAFNPDNLLEGYALNSDGTISESEGHSVAYVHVLAGSTSSGGNNGYRVKAKTGKSCTINRVGYYASVPTASVTATVLEATSLSDGRSSYVPSSEGYLLIDISTSDVENLLVALAWSYDPTGKNEDYWDSVVALPTVHDWGLGKAGTVYDEINLLDQTATKRVDRALMTDMSWEEIVTEHTTQEDIDGVLTDVTVNTYAYKSSSIASSVKASTTNLAHYGLLYDVTCDENGNITVSTGNTPIVPETAFAGVYLYYELATAVVEAEASEVIFDMDDFGTEEFIGSAIAPTYATFLYLPNMIDLVRGLVFNTEQANIREEKLLFENTSSTIYASDVNCTVKDVQYYNCSGLKFNGNSVAEDFVIQAGTVYNVTITMSADNAIVILKSEQIN